MLARAEAGSIGTFDPAEVKYSFDRIQERYSSDKFGVEIDLTLGVDTVAMPAETFQSIIASLVDNAYLHGGEDGGDRPGDPLNITTTMEVTTENRVLTQESQALALSRCRIPRERVVAVTGLEPVTSGL